MTQEAMIPHGSHHPAKAVPNSLEFGRAASGNPQVGLVFEITQGDYKGRRYPWIGTLAEGEATRITLDTLEAAGVTDYDGDDITKPVGLGSVECMLVFEHREQQTYENGQLVTVMDQRTGQPKLIPQIKYVNKMGGVRMKETLNDDERNSLAVSLAGTISARREKSGKRSSGIPVDPATGKPVF